jgi:hypothetical protein
MLFIAAGAMSGGADEHDARAAEQGAKLLHFAAGANCHKKRVKFAPVPHCAAARYNRAFSAHGATRSMFAS